MGTEQGIRARWKPISDWFVSETRDADDKTPIFTVRMDRKEMFSIGGDLSAAEQDFLRLTCHAPRDIHTLLTIIERQQAELNQLKAQQSIEPPQEAQEATPLPTDLDTAHQWIQTLRSSFWDVVKQTKNDPGEYYIALNEEQMRRVDLLYRTGMLSLELHELHDAQIPPEEWPELDEAFIDFVSESLDLAWDMAQIPNGRKRPLTA